MQRIILDKSYIPFGLAVASEQDTIGEHVFKFGYNAAVGNTAETLWAYGGLYTWPTAAATMDITSSDANDTSAGTGARTIVIEGLDANYAEISETITMNGQTAVVSTNSYLRVHRAYVATAGSGLTNAGLIYVANSSVTHTAGVPSDLTLIATTIEAGNGQTLQTFYTVPASKTAYLTRLSASTIDASNAVTITLRKRELGGAFRVQERFIVFQSSFSSAHDIPLVFPEKTDIEVQGVAAAATVDTAAQFDLILMPN